MNDNFNKTYMKIMNDYKILFETKGVFRKRGFISFIEFIKSIENNSGKTLSIDDMYRLGFKFYSKILKPNKKLVVCKFDFTSLKSMKRAMLLADEFNLISDYDIEMSFNKIHESKGSYISFSDDVSVILIKNDNETPDDTICHESIHYIQDMTGMEVGVITKYLSDFNDDRNSEFVPIEILAKLNQLETFDMIKKEMSPYMFNDREIIPYINNLCYFFESNNIIGKEPLNKINCLIVKMNELKNNHSDKIVFEFIDYMQNDTVWKKLFEDEEKLNLVVVLFICLFYNQHRTVLKKVVGNYFLV